jgi:queuine tRNA-ribosyltransferase
MARELSGYYLNTVHNLFFYVGLMKRIREAIREGRFESFYRTFMTEWKGGELQDGYSICDG